MFDYSHCLLLKDVKPVQDPLLLFLFSFYTPVYDGTYYGIPRVRLSVRPSVRPSVNVVRYVKYPLTDFLQILTQS